jgi:hypothetical protein
LLKRSEVFDDAAWASASGARTVTTNQISAPNGENTADLITADGTNAPHFISQSVTLTAVPVTFSIFAKAGTNDFLQLRCFNAFGGMFANFDLAAGTEGSVGTTSGATPTSSIQAYPDGWYRCVMVFTPIAATSSVGAYIVTSDSAPGSQSNSLATSVYVWGAQLEVGAFPTSYTKNVDAVLGAIRAADVVSISGSNFSSWYRQDEGTVFVDAASTRGSLVGFSDGTSTERYRLVAASTALAGFGTSGGSTQFNFNTGSDSWISPNSGKGALGLKLNNFSVVANGNYTATHPSGTLPNVDRVFIGNAQIDNPLNGHLRRLTYWPTRLGNEVLQTITQ